MSSQRYKLRSSFFAYLVLFLLIQKCATGRQIICGKALMEVLEAVCVNGFNNRLKRCLEAPKTSPLDDGWYYRLKDIIGKKERELDEDDIHVQSSIGINKQILIRKRKQAETYSPRGVADECCIHGCVYADILMYCA